jgi:hypothetical protein
MSAMGGKLILRECPQWWDAELGVAGIGGQQLMLV